MFKITDNKGFHIAFANGYTISVQFGPGNYGDNYNMAFSQHKNGEPVPPSRTAEIAVWNAKNEWWLADQVEGNCTPERVLEVMNQIAKLEA